MRVFVQTPTALTSREIREFYALADRHKVSICPWGGTGSPSDGPAEWGVSGGLLAIRRFLREAEVKVIPEPRYPAVARWTDAARWEKKGRDY